MITALCIIHFCSLQTSNLQSQDRMTTSVVIFLFAVALIGTQNYLSHAASGHIDVEDFSVGDCAEVHYTAPAARATVNLASEAGDVVLHCDYRVKYSSHVDTLLLNTKLAGESWDPSTRVLIPHVRSYVGQTLKFVLCAVAVNEISVTLKGELLASYTNSKMDITTVSRVIFNGNNQDAHLQKMCLNYP